MNQHTLLRLDGAEGGQGIPGGEGLGREGGALSEAPVVGQGDQVIRFAINNGAITAEAGDAHHPVANLEGAVGIVGVRACADDRAGKFQPGNEGPFRGCGVKTGKGENICKIQPHGMNLHPEVPGGQRRQWPLFLNQIGQAACLGRFPNRYLWHGGFRR